MGGRVETGCLALFLLDKISWGEVGYRQEMWIWLFLWTFLLFLHIFFLNGLFVLIYFLLFAILFIRLRSLPHRLSFPLAASSIHLRSRLFILPKVVGEKGQDPFFIFAVGGNHDYSLDAIILEVIISTKEIITLQYYSNAGQYSSGHVQPQRCQIVVENQLIICHWLSDFVLDGRIRESFQRVFVLYELYGCHQSRYQGIGQPEINLGFRK